MLSNRTLGGSAANVSKSLAVLSPETDVQFCGMVGNDAASALVIDGFTSHGVVPELLTTTKCTAMCLCLVRSARGVGGCVEHSVSEIEG